MRFYTDIIVARFLYFVCEGAEVPNRSDRSICKHTHPLGVQLRPINEGRGKVCRTIYSSTRAGLPSTIPQLTLVDASGGEGSSLCFTPLNGPFPARRSDKGLLSDFPALARMKKSLAVISVS